MPQTNEIKKPTLRFPEFGGEWNYLKLEDIGTFKNGINKSKEDFGFGFPFVNLMDVFGRPTISNLKLGLVNAREKELEQYNLNMGDVLFIRSSVKKEGVGETSLVLEDLQNTVYSGFLIRFRDEKLQLDLNFKKYCFLNRKFRKKLIALSSTSANTNINQESLNSLNIAIPSPAEQRKIASFLTSIDDWIENLKKQKEAQEKYKKGMMQKIFSQEIRFKDGNGNDYPEWEEKMLGEIGTFFSGGTPLSTNKEYYNGTIPFIGSADIYKPSVVNHISEEAMTSSSAKLVHKGDLLYALYGANSGEVAISKISGAINQAVLCIRTSESVEYIYYLLLFYKVQIVSKYLQGGQGNLSANIIKKLRIMVPVKEEQQKVADFLSSIDDLINLTSQRITQAEKWKKGVMQGVFV